MKRIVSALLVLCLLVGLTACGEPSEPVQEPVQEEITTTTTAVPVEEKLTYADIVGGVRRIMAKELPTLGSVTDEQQNTREDGSITKSFKYVDGNLSVTVTLKEGEVVSVIVLCNTSKLPPVDNMQPIAVASILMGIPASLIYSDGNVDKLISDFVANDPTSESDLGVTYVLTDENWEYVMNLSMLISTMSVVPLEQEETTTTAADTAITTGQIVNQQPTASKQSAATKQRTSSQKKSTTTQNKSTSNQNKPTSPAPTQNQDPCAYGHDWEITYKTVHHKEEGHYEEQQTGSSRVTIYKCAVCYQKHDSLTDYYSHFDSEHAGGGLNISIFREQYTTDTEYRAVYGQVWVVDQEAYDEEVAIGRKCRICDEEESY